MKLNFLKFFIFTFVSFQIYGQSLDESFLQSLPENIKNDFLGEMSTSDNLDEEIVSQDSRVKKLESALEEAERTLKLIRADLDDQENINNDKLPRFGENFFNSIQSSFLPVNEPNLGSNYVIDSGDILSIQLIGQSNKNIEVAVQRDGSIQIPNIKPIYVQGMNLQDASRLIELTASETFIGVAVYVSLKELRDMNVLIIGNVENPGMYTLSGGSTALSLIHAAGGITDVGSYRNILHKRDNILVQTIDLYEILIHGNLPLTKSLRSGDILVVGPKLNSVSLTGDFFNNAIYELLPDESLDDVMHIAGFSNVSASSEVFISRISDGRFQGLVIEKEDYSTTFLKDGDGVILTGVRPDFKKAITVNISGEVNVPGSYTLSNGATLSDLISAAGGYTEIAYPFGGVFLRENAKLIEEQIKDKSFDELVRFVIASPTFNQTAQPEGILSFLSLLKDYQPIGRVVTEFNMAKLGSNPSLDVVLANGDSIHIPQFRREVYVFGEVMNPGGYYFDSSFDVNEYLKSAGGLSRVADEQRIILVMPNGSSKIVTNSIFNNFNDIDIVPGSVIYASREIGKLDGINLAATVAPIVSSLALSLASLNSIN